MDPKEAISIPLLGRDGKHYWTEEEERSIWEEYAQLMGNPQAMKVNQNISFDIGFLYSQNNIITRGALGDTMVAFSIMYPDYPKGLDFITSLYTREPYYKDEGKTWKLDKRDWDWEAFWRYNAKDAIVALEAWTALEAEMEEYGYRDTYDMTMRCLDPLVFMQTKGFKVDRETLEATKLKVEAELVELRAELDGIAGKDAFNPASPKQCQKYFYGIKGLKPYINPKTSNITTDDRAMSRIVSMHGLKEAKLVQEIRRLAKLSSAYFDVNIDHDGRIRCSYNIRGTTTGRFSSSQTVFRTGMNLQNLHPSFKGFLVAG
jgi:DNA polymerase I-like protein with 3'-5' exonuclease and polymerase domains